MLNKEVCRKCVHEEYDGVWNSKDELDEKFEELWDSGTGFCWRGIIVLIQGPCPDKCLYKHLHTKNCDYCEERHCNQCELKKG